MAKKKKWMKEAFANAHGQFAAKAKKAGMSTREYAQKKKHAGGKLGKQANLALVGMKAGKKKKSRREPSAKEMKRAYRTTSG